MGYIRTYLDSSLIINAFSASTFLAQRALEVLNDTCRQFVLSDYVKLETLPKMRYNKRYEQSIYTEELFRHADYISSTDKIISKAEELASTYGLAAMDALHTASALAGSADELLTFEQLTKPFFRIPSAVLRIVSLYGKA